MDAGQNEPIPMAANEKWLLATKDIIVTKSVVQTIFTEEDL